jgi:hypothetical protein
MFANVNKYYPKFDDYEINFNKVKEEIDKHFERHDDCDDIVIINQLDYMISIKDNGKVIFFYEDNVEYDIIKENVLKIKKCFTKYNSEFNYKKNP